MGLIAKKFPVMCTATNQHENIPQLNIRNYFIRLEKRPQNIRCTTHTHTHRYTYKNIDTAEDSLKNRIP